MEKAFKKATYEVEDCLEQLEIINSTQLALHSCLFDASHANAPWGFVLRLSFPRQNPCLHIYIMEVHPSICESVYHQNVP